MALTQSKIPPQAYTRDTLVKAIEWLSGQPPAVRERANSADLIVSHYLQARRQATASQIEAPISQEHFKADLKHLAEDLKRFEEPSAPPPVASAARSPSYIVPPSYNPPDDHAPVHFRKSNPVQPSLPVQVLVPAPSPAPISAPVAPPAPPPVALPVAAAPTAVVAPEAVPKTPVWNIDPRSLASARELMERLNLSSETEALRMLITMGLAHAKGLGLT